MKRWRVLVSAVLLVGAWQANAGGAIQVEDPWVRATPPNARMGAGFLRLSNHGTSDDRLVELSSPAAARVEIHSMKEVDGVMQMRHLADGLPLPAGADVALAPGGLHLMFVGIGQPFVEGGSVELTLRFEHGTEQHIRLPVRAAGAAQ